MILWSTLPASTSSGWPVPLLARFPGRELNSWTSGCLNLKVKDSLYLAPLMISRLERSSRAKICCNCASVWQILITCANFSFSMLDCIDKVQHKWKRATSKRQPWRHEYQGSKVCCISFPVLNPPRDHILVDYYFIRRWCTVVVRSFLRHYLGVI